MTDIPFTLDQLGVWEAIKLLREALNRTDRFPCMYPNRRSVFRYKTYEKQLNVPLFDRGGRESPAA
jgi:hypothetical protein